MSEKMISERDAVMRERAASAKARCAALYSALPHPLNTDHEGHIFAPCEACRRKAVERYPLKVTRPRVVADSGGCWWRFVNGNLEVREGNAGCAWYAHDQYKYWLTLERVKLLADLIASPTEEVEDVG